MHHDLLPTIIALSDARRLATTDDHKSLWGQYFTPPEIASFMASKMRITPGQHLTVLDPGAGMGILRPAVARLKWHSIHFWCDLGDEVGVVGQSAITCATHCWSEEDSPCES